MLLSVLRVYAIIIPAASGKLQYIILVFFSFILFNSGNEYVFSNLQGRSCNKCNKPIGKCIKINALAKVEQIEKLFKLQDTGLRNVCFSMNQRGIRIECKYLRLCKI